jgi:pimeloyl-ACP methyl ester carboxylesterase
VEVTVDRTIPTALPGVATRLLDIPGRGSTTVWDAPGPPGAETLVLLHGVTLTASLNWSRIVGSLSRRYRVVLFDQRGHGSSPLRHRRFRLEECADDVAAVAERLGVDRLVPLGYSMGGLVAQLVWRRHRDLVSGLVLCSTARNFCGGPWEQSMALAMPGLVTAASWMSTIGGLRADAIGTALLDRDSDPADRRWALSEMRRTTLADALSAMHAVCDFTSHTWIGSVDVPTAVVLTRHDRVVPPRRQWKLARALPNPTVVELDGGHDVFLGAPGPFAAAVEAACDAVCPDRRTAGALGA